MSIYAISTISFLGIWYILFCGLPGTLLVSFRQKIFNLRNQLFAEAVKSNISFDHKAYRLVEAEMNGAIRYAHTLNLFDVFRFQRKEHASGTNLELEDQLPKITGDLTPDQIKVLKSYRKKLLIEASRFAKARSPIFALFLEILKAVLIIKKAFSPIPSPEDSAMEISIPRAIRRARDTYRLDTMQI
ncbi:MAG: hypothetical protein DSY80_10685 [Desulfocapsa sp.]|nr:MAG: hypothetical protein DSY80_10685 [Desulfocapsa sp.]